MGIILTFICLLYLAASRRLMDVLIQNIEPINKSSNNTYSIQYTYMFLSVHITAHH